MMYIQGCISLFLLSLLIFHFYGEGCEKMKKMFLLFLMLLTMFVTGCEGSGNNKNEKDLLVTSKVECYDKNAVEKHPRMK